MNDFQQQILRGIPENLPETAPIDLSVSHAPRRKDILTRDEKKLALRNALRYFKPRHHEVLVGEFARELENYGRIYMYRLRPGYPMHARPLQEYPHR